ncbi:MAG: hypothetical protein ACR2NH_09200 [Solirubrobacteraceae bacterium]
MVSRAVLLGLAIILAGWMAVGIRSAHREEVARHSTLLADPALPQRAIAGAHRTFARAGELNPDSAPELDRASYDIRTRHPQDAIGVLQDVVAREPENINAWALLAQASGRSNPALTARARVRIHALSPLGARR